MIAYALRRITATIPVILVVAFFVFSLLYLAPGDPAAVIAGDQATPADVERIRSLFDDLERKRDIAEFLELAETGEGVRIFIGSENKLFSLSGSSLVVSPYMNADRKIIGAVGVIGPTRLNYGRIVPIVDYTAQLVGRLKAGPVGQHAAPVARRHRQRVEHGERRGDRRFQIHRMCKHVRRSARLDDLTPVQHHNLSAKTERFIRIARDEHDNSACLRQQRLQVGDKPFAYLTEIGRAHV